MGMTSMAWILSYVTANFALIIVVVLAVLALAAVAWFAKNWKVAVAAVVVLALGFAYQQIDKNAYQRRVSEEAAAQTKVLQARLDVLTAVNDANTARAISDANKNEALEAKADDTPVNAAPCFDQNTAKRIGAIK